MSAMEIPVERHPLEPFLPPGARLLMLGSFPPPRKRWCMDFFYPNRSNMMWEIFGEVFFCDRQRLIDVECNTFRQKDIEALLAEKGIAIYDTAVAVRRLSGNASDRDLEIVERTDLAALLARIPRCHDIVCTGQKSLSAVIDGDERPIRMGEWDRVRIGEREVRLWRMPSSSRAYPMPLNDKVAHYRRMVQVVLGEDCVGCKGGKISS